MDFNVLIPISLIALTIGVFYYVMTNIFTPYIKNDISKDEIIQIESNSKAHFKKNINRDGEICYDVYTADNFYNAIPINNIDVDELMLNGNSKKRFTCRVDVIVIRTFFGNKMIKIIKSNRP